MISSGYTPHSFQSPLKGEGYLLLRSIDEKALWDVAASLGPIKTDPRHPQEIRFIRPQAISVAEPNTLSSRYGMNSFPFHTDAAHWQLPPTYVLLYCVEIGSGNRPTYLIDSRSWGLTKSELSALSSAVWRTGHAKPFLCTVTCPSDDGFTIRYDPGCMSPRSISGVKAAELIATKLSNAEYVTIEWQRGDLLVIHNQRLLHARGPAERADPDRVIARLLIGGKYGRLGF